MESAPLAAPTESQPPSLFERYPKATLILIAILGMGVVDFVSATLYRAAAGYPWTERGLVQVRAVEQTYRIPSPIYHHDLAPNVTVDSARWGNISYRVTTNVLGFKGRPSAVVPLQSGRHRILFIGDSFTEGVGVEYEQTFVGLIDEALAARDIDVLNAAVSSYSPIIYWRKIKHLLEDVKLDVDEVVVFIDVSDAKDESNYYLDEDSSVQSPGVSWLGSGATSDVENLAPWEVRPPGVYGFVRWFLARDSIVGFTVIQGLKSWLLDPKVSFSVNTPRSAWTVDEKLYREFGQLGTRRMKQYMTQLHGMLAERGIRLTVAVYPWPDQIVNRDLESIHVRLWRDWCRDRNVRYLNYFPYFVDAEADQADIERVLIKHFVNEDTHWNETGHKLIADVFLSFYAGEHAAAWFEER